MAKFDQKNKIGLVVYGVPFYGKDHRVIRACATPELAQKFIDWVRKSPQAYSAEASGWRVQEHTLFESEEDFEYSNCNCVVDYSTKNSNPPGRLQFLVETGSLKPPTPVIARSNAQWSPSLDERKRAARVGIRFQRRFKDGGADRPDEYYWMAWYGDSCAAGVCVESWDDVLDFARGQGVVDFNS